MELEVSNAREFLRQELDRRLKANPQYSLRAFARNLGLSPGELSEVLRGKRRLSQRSALKAAKSLGLSARETQDLLLILQKDKVSALGFVELDQPDSSEKLTEASFQRVSEWYHFAILNLFDCRGFRWEGAWISRRLGISPLHAKMAMRDLLETGLVELKGGQARTSDKMLETGGLDNSLAIRKYHQQILTKGLQALETLSRDQREVTGIGLACGKKEFERIRKEISKFLDDLASRYHLHKADDVYQLEVLLFPLTHKESP